jgi:DNA-binding MarR family transcriptional regulator
MSPEDPVDPLVDALVRTTFEVTGVLTRLAAAHDLSLTQVRVLGILRDRRARVTDLAAYLGLDKSTMSGLIDRAERRGLLARDRNPHDGRAVDVFMTPAGHALTERAYLDVRDALMPTLDRLPGAQQAQLRDLLETLLGDTLDTPDAPTT